MGEAVPQCEAKRAASIPIPLCVSMPSLLIDSHIIILTSSSSHQIIHQYDVCRFFELDLATAAAGVDRLVDILAHVVYRTQRTGSGEGVRQCVGVSVELVAGVRETSAPATRVVLVAVGLRVREAGLNAAAHVVDYREVHLLEFAVVVAHVDVAVRLVASGERAAGRDA